MYLKQKLKQTGLMKKKIRYNTGYLEHFKWNKKMKSPSVTSGLKEKE